MNLILRSCLKMLNLVMLKRDYYDPGGETHVELVVFCDPLFNNLNIHHE